MFTTDRLGFNFEGECLDAFTQAGLGKYMTYHNSRNEYSWKRHTNGPDFTFIINAQVIDIDCSYQSHYYRYTYKWFMRDKLPRFTESSTGTTKIITAKIAESFYSISWLTTKHSVTVHSLVDTVNWLLSLTTTLIDNNNTTTKHNTVYAYGRTVNYNSELDRKLEEIVVRPVYLEWLKYRYDVGQDV